MLKHKARWLLAGLLGLALLSACEQGGDKEWEKYNSAGRQAYDRASLQALTGDPRKGSRTRLKAAMAPP